MPEADIVSEATLNDVQPQGTNETDGNAPSEDTASAVNSLIFDKYKTMDEAHKGFKEAESKAGRLADEVGRLRFETEQLRQQAQMKEALIALAEANKPKQEPMDLQAYAKTLGPKFNENPEEAVAELMTVNNTWLKQTEDKMATNLSQIEKRIMSLNESLDEKLERLSPEYQQNKELIDSLVGSGMPLAKAKEWVKKNGLTSSSGRESPIPRNTPPASLTPSRNIGANNSPAPDYLWTVDELPQLAVTYPELDEKGLLEKMKELNAKRTARAKAGQPVRKTIRKEE